MAPGFEAEAWYALLVPAGTPAGIVNRIRDETLKALRDPEVQASLASNGLNIAPSTPAELAARIRKETTVWEGVIKEASIRIDQ